MPCSKWWGLSGQSLVSIQEAGEEIQVFLPPTIKVSQALDEDACEGIGSFIKKGFKFVSKHRAADRGGNSEKTELLALRLLVCLLRSLAERFTQSTIKIQIVQQRQRALLPFLTDHTAPNGFSPTASTNQVNGHKLDFG